MAEDGLPRAVADSLGGTERLAGTVDPAALARAYTRAMVGAALRPWATVPVLARYGASVATTTAAGIGRRFGRPPATPDPVSADPRFADPAWSDDAAWWTLAQLSLVHARLLEDLVDAAGLDVATATKARFTASLLADALAPSNFLLTNPIAIREAVATGGRSVLRGMANFLRDVADNDGWPRQVDRSRFEVGRTLAATPGQVVFRNELIEVIQYAPVTDDVHEIPLVIVPPWINRFYIADLAPGKSLVEWAVQHGHTTFAVSYRNPDESIAALDFDDYVRLGPMTAIDVVRDIAGVPAVNTLAICLAGAMHALLLAHHAAQGDASVNAATFLNSALDYRDGGILGSVFADAASVATLADRVRDRGFMEAKEMAHTFDVIRANDLVFRYLVEGWLLGHDPPAFDLLAWNADAMRIPGKAHLTFLRNFYLQHAPARDATELFGARVSLADVATDLYLVAAKDDHIVPWRASYRTTQMVKGPVRFVLTSSGHIAGMVNPPHPKTRHWINSELPAEPERWLEGATEQRRSWWEDWIEWLGERAGPRVAPPPMGGGRFESLGPAPGTYVLS